MKKRRTRIGCIVITWILLISFSLNAWASTSAEAAPLKPSLAVAEQKTLAPGVKYLRYTGKTADGKPLRVYVLEADISRNDVEVKPVISAKGVGQREKLSSMAQSVGALAAVNGTFFTTGNPSLPLGNLVIDGEYLAISDILRTSVGITADEKVNFGYFNPKLTLVTQSGQHISITGVNRNPASKDVLLYTPEWKNKVTAGTGRVVVSLKKGTGGQLVVAETTTGSLAIPSQGYVVSLPADLAGPLEVGASVELKVSHDPYWDGVKHLLTGGPLLVEKGEPVFQAVAEGFKGSILERNPRTALGVTKDGRLLLVVVDGRSSNSVGATYEELSYIMLAVGAYQAVGLDGGGSSEMWIQGKVVNRPSDGTERNIHNGLAIIVGIPVYLNGQQLYFDVPPQIINGRTMVPFRKIFEALGAQVDYDAKTKTVKATKDGRVVQLVLGAKEALVDGKSYTLDVPAMELKGRTLVPLRFVSVALGGTVEWTSDRKVVITVK